LLGFFSICYYPDKDLAEFSDYKLGGASMQISSFTSLTVSSFMRQLIQVQEPTGGPPQLPPSTRPANYPCRQVGIISAEFSGDKFEE